MREGLCLRLHLFPFHLFVLMPLRGGEDSVHGGHHRCAGVYSSTYSVSFSHAHRV